MTPLRLIQWAGAIAVVFVLAALTAAVVIGIVTSAGRNDRGRR